MIYYYIMQSMEINETLVMAITKLQQLNKRKKNIQLEITDLYENIQNMKQQNISRDTNDNVNRVINYEISYDTDNSTRNNIDYGQDYGRDYGQDYGQNYGRNYGRDYGQNYERDYGRDYGQNYGRDYGQNYGRDYGTNYGRDYGTNYGMDYGTSYGQDYGTNYGKDNDIQSNITVEYAPKNIKSLSTNIINGQIRNTTDINIKTELINNNMESLDKDNIIDNVNIIETLPASSINNLNISELFKMRSTDFMKIHKIFNKENIDKTLIAAALYNSVPTLNVYDLNTVSYLFAKI